MSDEDSSKPMKPYSRLEEYNQQMAELRSAIGGFLTSFATFEAHSLTAAIKALSHDPVLVEHLPELMSLYDRLKLLKLLGVARQLPDQLQEDIAHLRSIGNDLLECRNDIAHGMAALFGDFLNDTNADLTPGVLRRLSHRVPPKGELTPDQVDALNKEWTHDLPTIVEWTQCAEQLQRIAYQLAHKLDRYRRGEPWENTVVTRMEKASKKRKSEASTKPSSSRKKKVNRPAESS